MGCNVRLIIQVAKNGVIITTEDDIVTETQLCLSHRQAMFYISKELWRLTKSFWKKPGTEKSDPTEDSDPY
jgi:hypothetical protein